MEVTEAVKVAASHFGSQRKMAEALGITTPLVNAWSHGNKPVHPRFCYAIEIMTGSKVKARELNPECFDKALIRKRIREEKVCHVELRFEKGETA